MKYKILYNEIEIGLLEINDAGYHRYTPDKCGVETVGSGAPLTPEIRKGTDWVEPLPYFQRSIDDAKRFSQEKYIYSQTDKFEMILIP